MVSRIAPEAVPAQGTDDPKSLAMIGNADAGDGEGREGFRAEALSIAGLEGSRRRIAAMGFGRV
jgi:hypothetical protein